VIAFHRPGRPANGIPRDRARGRPAGVAACGSAWLGVFTVTNLHIDYVKSFTVIVSL
jgi:hypothetical protein